MTNWQSVGFQGGLGNLEMPVEQELLLDWLHPLLLRVADGSTLDWNLQARFQVGEQLPPLSRDGDGGRP